MEKAMAFFKTAAVFVFLFSFGNVSGESSYRYLSDEGQQTPQNPQTQTKPTQTQTQTQTKSTQTQTKSTQTKSTQSKPKSTTSASKSTQTKPKTSTTKPKTSTTKPKTSTTKPKTTQASPKPEPVKKSEPGIIPIGDQKWAYANLNVSTFRNGDSIPEAKTYNEWVAAGQAGKPAWCYYNNDSTKGKKYGKLYNWYAVNDQRGLAPNGWAIADEEDWAELVHYLGGQAMAGAKMKSTTGWSEGYNGTDESGFNALPGGYRIENGLFKNFGSIATWWSTSENNTSSATDHYIGQSGTINSSSTPKQRGQSVRCIRKQ